MKMWKGYGGFLAHCGAKSIFIGMVGRKYNELFISSHERSSTLHLPDWGVSVSDSKRGEIRIFRSWISKLAGRYYCKKVIKGG